MLSQLQAQLLNQHYGLDLDFPRFAGLSSRYLRSCLGTPHAAKSEDSFASDLLSLVARLAPPLGKLGMVRAGIGHRSRLGSRVTQYSG